MVRFRSGLRHFRFRPPDGDRSSVRFGPYEATIVSDGRYRLDGGAMFGVVPKVLWEREHPADELNRVDLALNCLLLRSDERTVLIDTGMGPDWTEHEVEMYALDRPDGGLVGALARQGVRPDDVTDVVLTHLHFDHCGGCVHRDGNGELVPTFATAKHWVQAQHLRWGREPTERDRRSFRAETFEPFLAAGTEVELVDGPQEILPQVHVRVVNGHTPGQQVVIVGDRTEPRLFYAADLVPFASHVHLPWIMAFDLNPLLTLQEKRDLLSSAITDDMVVVFEHDSRRPAARVTFEKGRNRIAEEVEL